MDAMLTSMGRSHSSRAGRTALGLLAALVSAAAAPARAQQPVTTQSTAAPSGFTIFLRSVPIGREQVDVEKTANGWTISSTGQFNPPVDIVFQRVLAQYDSDWRPL